MKNINVIKFIIPVALLILGSCEDDEEGIGLPVIPDQMNITADLTFDNANEPFFGAGESLDFTATLNGNSEQAREVRVESQTGQSRITEFAIASEGSSMATGTINIPDIFGSFDFDSRGVFSAEIVGVRNGDIEIDEESGEESFIPSGGDTVATTSEEATVPIFDLVPSANPAGLNYLLDWRNPGMIDIDLEVINGDGSQVENAASGSRYEGDLFDNTNLDGTYTFNVLVFDPVNMMTSEAIEFRLFVIDSQGNKTLLEFSLPAGTTTNVNISVAEFTQITTPDAIEYDNIQLL